MLPADSVLSYSDYHMRGKQLNMMVLKDEVIGYIIGACKVNAGNWKKRNSEAFKFAVFSIILTSGYYSLDTNATEQMLKITRKLN